MLLACTAGTTTEAAAPVAAAASPTTTNTGANAGATAAADANAPATTTNDEAIPMANLETMPPLPPIPPPINDAHVYALQDEWMMPRHKTYKYALRPFFQYVHRRDAPYPKGTTFSKGQFLQIQLGHVRDYLAYKPLAKPTMTMPTVIALSSTKHLLSRMLRRLSAIFSQSKCLTSMAKATQQKAR
jgi:hypothetical protein